MKYDPEIHGKTQLIKSALGKLESAFGFRSYKPNELIVLNYHGTQKEHLIGFERQMDFVQEHFKVIDPSALVGFFNRPEDFNSGPYFMVSFDDGLKNNLNAIEVLEKKGLKAIHFIVPGFVKSTSSKEFYLKHIRPSINPLLDKNIEDFTPMSLEEIRTLLENGHTIGSHTMNHILWSAMDEATQLDEIINSKAWFKRELDLEVNSFCSPNNTLLSVDKCGLALIEKGYDYHFTTIAGSNTSGGNPLFIKRMNVEAHWPFGQFINAIGHWDQLRWKGKSKTFETLLNKD